MDELGYLDGLSAMISQSEKIVNEWVKKTFPTDVQYEVSQTSGEIFALHLIHHELRALRLEVVRQNILTRAVLRNINVEYGKADESEQSSEASEPTGGGEGKTVSATVDGQDAE